MSTDATASGELAAEVANSELMYLFLTPTWTFARLAASRT